MRSYSVHRTASSDAVSSAFWETTRRLGLFLSAQVTQQKNLCCSGIEPEPSRVLSERDNHYTNNTVHSLQSKLVEHMFAISRDFQDRPLMNDGGDRGGWRPIRDLISFFENATGEPWAQGGMCDKPLRTDRVLLEETFPSAYAHGRRLLFEEKLRRFRSEIQDARASPAQILRDSVCAERSQRQRILQQRRDAGRNKTIVTSHISMLLQGRERDDGVLRPSMLNTRGDAMSLGQDMCPGKRSPGHGA